MKYLVAVVLLLFRFSFCKAGWEGPRSEPQENWSTYQNKNIGFTFKYPSGLFTKESTDDLGVWTVLFRRGADFQNAGEIEFSVIPFGLDVDIGHKTFISKSRIWEDRDHESICPEVITIGESLYVVHGQNNMVGYEAWAVLGSDQKVYRWKSYSGGNSELVQKMISTFVFPKGQKSVKAKCK